MKNVEQLKKAVEKKYSFATVTLADRCFVVRDGHFTLWVTFAEAEALI